MNRFNTEAIVLKHIKYKDTDRIYTIFSKDKGRISVVAKGVRKITSRRSGSLDTLNRVVVQLNKHKSGQLYVSEIETLATYKKIKMDYSLSKKAFYLAEMMSKVIWEDENIQNVYELFVKTLDVLEEKKENQMITVNKFEIKLMQLLGYEPPKELLLNWRQKVRQEDIVSANMLIKNFLAETLGENMKSLELD